MRSIYKYTLRVTDEQEIEMPRGARILSVQNQREDICVWVDVDVDATPTIRIFSVYGTGHELPGDISLTGKFLGSVQLSGGSLVFHVYERGTNHG